MTEFPIRLDHYLMTTGLFSSRTQAQKAIKAGIVADQQGRIFNKSSYLVENETPFHLTAELSDFASRAALKLEKAVRVFHFQLEGQTVIDVGASTGGFTDVSLRQGVTLVYAVDVGHDQLIDRLKEDPRVKNMPGYNFRYAKKSDFEKQFPTRAVIDVSFISLNLILPALFPILTAEGELIALFKPQFEVGKENIGKKGIVKHARPVWEAFENLVKHAQQLGFFSAAFTSSPIKGGDGNREFLLYLKKSDKKVDFASFLANSRKTIFNSYQKSSLKG
ncbi:MAG: TlyA family RNA methyltransferase [Oenococcus sp.]|uniref:TlyA family RNA methyltransferase n=1 Tax=Oenococcus TaxID=46254 RepID=UPI0021E78770|nr:TlyA family RNA methyltransferase [Oenococcus kitaharae]MCV3296051.1 TlyA family RNA methyltransferase [Oenococcus kitaharae]